MSAYIVDKNHIVYLVAAAMSRSINRYGGSFSWYHKTAPNQADRHQQLACNDYEKAADVANMLWQENIKSVSYRYPGESSGDLPGPIGGSFVVTATDITRCPFHSFDPVQILKSVSCYEYQTCEHDEWEESAAFAFMKSLEGAAIGALPGYDDAVWGAPERATNLRRVA